VISPPWAERRWEETPARAIDAASREIITRAAR
jgi:hypothetical protein